MVKQSLKDKTVKGVGWNAVDRIANYGIGFVVSIVLARLLTPEEYGLLGIIAIFIAIQQLSFVKTESQIQTIARYSGRISF